MMSEREEIEELKEENRRLLIKVRQLQDKLSDKNREINRRHRDDYESIDFGDDYDRDR